MDPERNQSYDRKDNHRIRTSKQQENGKKKILMHCFSLSKEYPAHYNQTLSYTIQQPKHGRPSKTASIKKLQTPTSFLSKMYSLTTLKPDKTSSITQPTSKTHRTDQRHEANKPQKTKNPSSTSPNLCVNQRSLKEQFI